MKLFQKPWKAPKDGGKAGRVRKRLRQHQSYSTGKAPPLQEKPPLLFEVLKRRGGFSWNRENFQILVCFYCWKRSEMLRKRVFFHWKTPILRAVFEKNRACGALISNSHHFQQSQAVWKRHSSDQFQCASLSTLSAVFASWNSSQSAAGAKILKEKQQQQRFSLRKTANIRLKTQ